MFKSFLNRFTEQSTLSGILGFAIVLTLVQPQLAVVYMAFGFSPGTVETITAVIGLLAGIAKAYLPETTK